MLWTCRGGETTAFGWRPRAPKSRARILPAVHALYAWSPQAHAVRSDLEKDVYRVDPTCWRSTVVLVWLNNPCVDRRDQLKFAVANLGMKMWSNDLTNGPRKMS